VGAQLATLWHTDRASSLDDRCEEREDVGVSEIELIGEEPVREGVEGGVRGSEGEMRERDERARRG
jgi:hypothetical protein